jgi:hypothetical protein
MESPSAWSFVTSLRWAEGSARGWRSGGFLTVPFVCAKTTNICSVGELRIVRTKGKATTSESILEGVRNAAAGSPALEF